jgi:iron complex transport system substrate-binding protein
VHPRIKLTIVAACIAATAACGGNTSSNDTAASADPPSSTAATSPVDTSATAASFSATLDSCGTTLSFDAPPERVVLMEASYVNVLDSLGALDSIVTTIGNFPSAYYTPDQQAALAGIPNLASEQESTGGVIVSLEAVVALEPDLVIGYETDALTAAGLAERDIPLYTIPPFCDTPPPVSFDNVYAEIERLGEVFDAPAAAEAANTELRSRLAAFDGNATGNGRTAAALFVSSDGSAVYGYSKLGMVHPQMEALGLVNVFADLPERVPEVSVEELIDRNPEVLILLYTDTAATSQDITNLVTGLPGADAIAAVQSGTLIPMLFNFAEPPSPLVFDGLDLLSAALTE